MKQSLLLLFLVCFCSFGLLAQKSISGTVTDQDGEALIGASVQVKGTSIGVVTDLDGSFSITVPNDATTLVVAYVGFTPAEIEMGNTTVFTITLNQGTALNEVVVTGYGTTNRRDVTGAITKLTPDDFNRGAITSVNSLLQGRVAGLTISKAGNDPTRGPSVLLRGPSTLGGSTEPLYVIDGVPGATLATIAPEDIVSMEVLKDAASTAIYGTRASNGVIMVTTRGGEPKPYLSYHGYASVSNIDKRIEVANSSQLKSYLQSAGKTLTAAYDLGFDTDWQDEATQTGSAQNHNVQFGGGSANSNYNASFTFYDETGIIINSGTQRLIGRLNLGHKMFNEKLKTNLTFANSFIKQDLINPYALYHTLRFLPTVPVYNADGSYFQDFGNQEFINPVSILNEEKRTNTFIDFTAIAKASLEIVKGLNFEVNGSLSNGNNGYDEYQSRVSPFNGANQNDKGYALRRFSRNTSQLIETYLNYDKQFGVHGLKLLAGYSYQVDEFGNGLTAQNTNFVSDDLGSYGLGQGAPNAAATYLFLPGQPGYSETKIASFFGRVNYSLNGKYIFQASLRRDGSSRFGANEKWAVFPAASFAWRISDEEFLKGSSFINDLKFRVGYGVSGFQAINPYQSLTRYSNVPQKVYVDGKYIDTYEVTQVPNPNLKWEKTATFNAGLDFTFLEGKLSGTIDVYDKTTTDMLAVYSVPVPPFPIDRIFANAGEMNNKGVELYLEVKPVTSEKFGWASGVNFAYNKNEIVSLSNDLFSKTIEFRGEPGGQGLTGINLQALIPGQPLGTFYNYKFAGTNENGTHNIYNAAGEVIPIGNGKAPNDYRILGKGIPDITLGWNNNLNFGPVSVNFLLRGMFGHSLFNVYDANLARLNDATKYNVSLKAIEDGNPNAPVYSSYFLEKGDFLKLDNATISYKLPANIGILKGATIYLNGQNLFTLTNYTGIDPEVDFSSTSPGVQGNLNRFNPFSADRVYFRAKTFTMGVQANF